MRSSRGLITLLVAVATLIVFAVGLVEAIVIGAEGTLGSGPTCHACIYRLTFTPDGDGWAVGNGGHVLHYHEGAWTWMDLPTDAYLVDVTPLPSGDVWAVGDSTQRYHNGRWTLDHALPSEDFLEGISMATPDEGWAVGESYSSDGVRAGLLAHYAGGAWTFLPSMPSISLYSVAMVSRGEGWAVGMRWSGNAVIGGVILHYQRDAWVPVPSPVPVDFVRVAMRSPNDGWIVGPDLGGGAFLHYSHGQWVQAPGPDNVNVSDVALTGASDGWAVGSRNTGDATPGAPLLFHLEGDHWAAQPIPDHANDYGALAVATDGSVWLAGLARDPLGAQSAHGVFSHLRNGAWTSTDVAREALPALFAVALPISTVAVGLLCLALGYATVRVLRSTDLARRRRLAGSGTLVLTFLGAAPIEAIQLAALIYPGDLAAISMVVGFWMLGAYALMGIVFIWRLIYGLRQFHHASQDG